VVPPYSEFSSQRSVPAVELQIRPGRNLSGSSKGLTDRWTLCTTWTHWPWRWSDCNS